MPKPTLLLLHGALGASDLFAPLLPLLDDRYRVHTLDFEGHGRNAPPTRPVCIEHFVENVVGCMSRLDVERAHVFGYSMGGFVACAAARAHPQRIRSIATLGTIFRWNREVAAREAAFLDPQAIAAKVPRFARALAERHTEAGWERLVHGTRDMLWALAEQGGMTPGELQALPHRVRIMVGDRDPSIDLANSHEIARALPRGELEVLPGTPHPFEKVPLDRLAFSLSEFLGSE